MNEFGPVFSQADTVHIIWLKNDDKQKNLRTVHMHLIEDPVN